MQVTATDRSLPESCRYSLLIALTTQLVGGLQVRLIFSFRSISLNEVPRTNSRMITLMSVIVAFLFAISLWYLSSNHKVTSVKLKATSLKLPPNRSRHRLTPAQGVHLIRCYQIIQLFIIHTSIVTIIHPIIVCIYFNK